MKQSAKPRPPQHLVFDADEWKKLQEMFLRDDRRHDAALMRWLENGATKCTVERISPASTAKRGPKQIWSDDMVIYAWFAIEVERLKAKAGAVKPFLDMLFKRLARRREPLSVHFHAGTGSLTKIENAETARRLYARAQKMMADDPRLAARWHKLAQRAASDKRLWGE